MMCPTETSIEEGLQASDADQQKKEHTAQDDNVQKWDGGVADYDTGYAGENTTQGAGAVASDEGGEVDYWEEVTVEDGSVCFYNHTSQEYSSSLPTNDATTPIVESPAYTTNYDEPQSAAAWESRNQGGSERWEGQVWDGVDGEIFVPWPEEEPQAMTASPVEVQSSDEQPEKPEEDEEDEVPFTPDDPAIVREQNLRALLVLLPAKIMTGVVRAAMEGAVLHTRRTATAEAERRRRSLLSSRAQFRHTMEITPKVATPGQLVPNGGAEQEDGGGMNNEKETHSTAEGETAETPGSWRNTTTQERDTLVGHKLQEVLKVLYSTTKEEARLTMRAIYLSSQGIGAKGARQLAPALKSCVIVALHLGNNAMGDMGVTSLADGLRHARGLQKLHLNDNEITDVGCHRLANALGPLKVLYTLDLCHNPFGDKACLSIATYLSQPGCPLRSLSVAGCLDVDPAAWKTISVRGREDGMGWDPPRPGDDGAVSLAAALMSPHGCRLRRLRLANAGVRTIGAKAIAAALCANHTLETVDLSGNDFGCKADENAWESAAGLLSFGLEVNRTVHTIVLRACGLSREQVNTIQANASPQTPGARKFHRGGDEDREILPAKDGSGGGGAGTGENGVVAKRGPLPWREEKRLGFRAACLLDWLLDAARVQGLRYPRPRSPGQDDTAPSVVKTASGQYGNEVSTVAPEDSGGNAPNTNEDQDKSLVEPRLWAGLTALQLLVSSRESGLPLPSGVLSIDGVLDTTSGCSSCRNRKTRQSSQALETDERDVLKVDSNDGRFTERERQTVPATSDRAEGMTVVTGELRPSSHGNPERKGGGGASKTRTNPESRSSTPRSSASQSTASPSVSSQESSSSPGSTRSSTTRPSFSEGDQSPEAFRSGRNNEDGEIRRSLSNHKGGSSFESSERAESFSSHHEALCREERSEEEEGSPATNINISHKAVGRAENRDERGSGQVSQVLCEREGAHVRAADLEAGSQEGHRLASLTATTCKDLDEQEAALSRERRSLGQERDEASRRTLEEASLLETSLAEARVVRDLAGDSVRRLEPITTAARNSERAARVELEEFRVSSRGREVDPHDDTIGLVSLEQLENDWGERSQHALAMAEELQEGHDNLGQAERRIEELEVAERGLQSRSAEYNITFREKTAENSSSMAALRAKRAALRRTENKLVALAEKLVKLADMASEEEALRALVPAGSERWDLDLQVAEAVRMTSEVAREVTQARLRRDEAAVTLSQARRPVVATKPSNGSGQDLALLAAAESAATRPRTAPSLSSSGLASSKKETEAIQCFDHSPTAAEDDSPPCVLHDAPEVTHGDLKGRLVRPSTSAASTGPEGSEADDDRAGRQGQHRRDGSEGKGNEGGGRGGKEQGYNAVEKALAGAGTAGEAAEDGTQTTTEKATTVVSSTETTAEAENMRHLVEAYSEEDRKFLDAVARGESALVKRAQALIRDHGDILRLKERDTPDDAHHDGLVQGRAKRRPRGETPLLGVQLNAHIALGAKIAMLRGSGEEDEDGNPILPEIDDRSLTVGQRLRRLRDVREVAQREWHRAYMEYSRQVKRNLRARKRFVLSEKQAGRIAQTMDTKQLVEALRKRGCSTEGSEELDQLRRVYVQGIQPEMRVRLHATSRWTKSRNKHREKNNNNTVQIGEIAARRQQRLLLPNMTNGTTIPPFSAQRFAGHDVRHAATA